MGQLSLLFILLPVLPLAIAANNRFRQWFPHYSNHFTYVVAHNCSQQYQEYRDGTGLLNQGCSYALDCILAATTESIKSNMGSAAVVLGLTPTILTMLGCGTAEIALLSTRRRFLSLCLALGSPSVVPIRTYQYDDVFEILKIPEGVPQHSRVSHPNKVFLTVGEYLLALGAIANVATVSYDIGAKALFTFSCNQSYYALIWAFLAMMIQVIGSVAFRLRFEWEDLEENNTSQNSNFLTKWLQNEIFPCSFLSRGVIQLQPPTLLFPVCCWITAALAASHILFGTLLFSSLTFISVVDALLIVARYMISAIVCRSILMYELSCMREKTVVEVENVVREPYGK